MKKTVAFGQYVLHFSPLALYEGRRLVPLPQKSLEVLELLLKERGQPVSREVFRERIWANSYIDEGNLTQAVFTLRHALGKLPDGRPFIRTIPRFGYQFAPAAPQSARRLGPADEKVDTASVPSQMGDAEQFRLLVDSIEEYAIYMLDSTGRVITWNPGAEKNKGYSAAEVLGQHFSMFFVPEDVAARIPDLELSKATRSGKCVGEGWRIRKSGERFWASFVITSIRDPRGKLLGFAKVVRDLTERKQQEDTRLRMDAVLKRERDRLEAAAESSNDALYICEPIRAENGEIEDFVFTYLNKSAERMISIPRESLLGGKMCELLPINRERGLFEEYVKVVETGRPYFSELEIHHPKVTIQSLRAQALAFEGAIAITVSELTDVKQGK